MVAVRSGRAEMSAAKLKTIKMRGHFRRNSILALGMKVNRHWIGTIHFTCPSDAGIGQ